MTRLFTILILISALFLPNTKGYSQRSSEPLESEPLKGTVKPEVKNKLTSREIYFEKGNSSFRFKYSARIQTRFDSWTYQNGDKENGNELYFRRIRFKSDGHLFTPKLAYKIEIDLLNPSMLDAVIKWNFYKNVSIWAGQTKLRGNRERVISSQNLQLVDRSLLNSKFTLDRDIGIWLSNHFYAGNIMLRTVFSITKGEGRYILMADDEPINNGLDYTVRLEVLPFGAFKNNGDYKGGDLEREQTPKLAVGISYDFNDNAARSRGHKGSFVQSEADLYTWIVDFMFKYNGFSWMGEYANRKVGGILSGIEDTTPGYTSDFYLGDAFNMQVGYLLGKNFEVAARFTQVTPLFDNNQLKEYTIGISKYIVGHKIKVQTDYGIFTEAPDITQNIYRLQFELSL